MNPHQPLIKPSPIATFDDQAKRVRDDCLAQLEKLLTDAINDGRYIKARTHVMPDGSKIMQVQVGPPAIDKILEAK